MRNVPISESVTRTDIAAWIVAALALALIIKLHLLSALLAGLLVFKLVDVLTPWLRLRALGRDGPRVLAVTLIATAVIAALIGIGVGVVALLRNSGESVPLLMQKMAQIIEDARAMLPPGLRGYLPEDTATLQQTMAEWLRTNAGALQIAGRGIGRSLVHVLMGMIIGALISMQKAANPFNTPRASPPPSSAWCSRSSTSRSSIPSSRGSISTWCCASSASTCRS
jgi:predicted PurR-regulated permease PerM